MAERQENRRKQDIVFLNILFCLLVIFIHISSEIILEMGRGRTMFWAVFVLSKLSGFVVQGFILLSGVKLFLKAGNMHYGKFYFSRLISVVLPYIAWVFLYYLYFCWRDYYVFSWAELGRFLLYGNLSAHFYFIVVLVQFYLLAPVWMFLFKRANPVVTLLVTLMISVLSGMCLGEAVQLLVPGADISHLDILFPRYLFYWAAGCMIGLHYQEFQSYLRGHWFAITLLFLVCAVLNAWLAIVFIDGAPYWMDQLHVLYCISAILFCYMLAQLFTDGGAILLKPVAGLDRASYSIYLIHCLVIYMVNEYMDTHGITDLTARYGWRALATYCGSIILCLVWQVSKNAVANLIRKT